jgi:hypothetical protein
LAEPVEELERRAQAQGLQTTEALGPTLLKFTGGAAPLLRGEPPDDPSNFSLKHDVLAVMLSRWHDEHGGALRAKREQAAKRRRIATVSLWTLLAILPFLVFAAMLYYRGEEALRTVTKAVDFTSGYAIRALDGNFRRSLLLLTANLGTIEQPGDVHEWITGGYKRLRVETVTELRKILSRTPWFAGRFAAIGLDPIKGRLALLQQDQTALLTLSIPSEDGERADPESKPFNLPDRAARQSMLRPAAGFVSGLGPVALVDGYAYFWNERGERQECDLEANLPQASGSWMRAEFIAGQLQLSTVERRARVSNLLILRLAASNLRSCSNPISAAEPLQVAERAPSQPVPVFAEAPDARYASGYLEETRERPPNELAANLPVDRAWGATGKLVELDAVLNAGDRQGPPVRIPVGQVAPERGVPERLHYSLAFAVNAQAIVFKFDGPDFYVYDLTDSRPGNRPDDVRSPRHVAVATDFADYEAWQLWPGRLPWLYPPLAAAKIAQHWRAAWLAKNGVWAIESSDRDPGTARPLLDAPLIGEPDGVKLQFTADGEFLLATGARGSIRVWNLRPSWRAWIEAPTTTEQELRRVACRIVRADGLGGAFEDSELELFQIDRAHREPCPEPKGVNG